jgi:hypothetical protein
VPEDHFLITIVAVASLLQLSLLRAKELIASRRARPEEIAIATASPEEWDDHFLALGDMSGTDLHFVHGRKVLTEMTWQDNLEALLRRVAHDYDEVANDLEAGATEIRHKELIRE